MFLKTSQNSLSGTNAGDGSNRGSVAEGGRTLLTFKIDFIDHSSYTFITQKPGRFSSTSTMKVSSAITLITSSTLLTGAASQSPCKTVTSLDDFDLDKFTSAKWYSHQQRESPFQSKALFNCVTAEYSFLNPANGAQEEAGVANGYGIKVFNYSEDIGGKVYTSDDKVGENGAPLPGALCAGSQVFEGDKISEVTVGFCTVPVVSFEQSNYWVLAYDNEDGYALIAGGQTNVPTLDGLCSYGNPTSGLWIFSRSSERNEDMIKKYRDIAIDNGIDPSIMKDVSHDNCDGNEPPSWSMKSKKSKSKKSKSKKSKSKKTKSSKSNWEMSTKGSSKKSKNA